jgi:hypothetical protein
VDITDADISDTLGTHNNGLGGHDDEICVRSDGEFAATCAVDQCESNPDDGLGMPPPDGDFDAYVSSLV